MIKPSQKKVAQMIKASVGSGLVFVQSFPDRATLNTVTASSIVSNKAAYSCGHCHTSVVASAGAEPHCVVCGTKTTSTQASVKIAPPADMSEMTAVECSSCKSVSILETGVITASGNHVHCSVCGHENDYNPKETSEITASMQKVIAAFKLKDFWNGSSKDFSATYKTTKPLAVVAAEEALSVAPDVIGMLTPGGRVILAQMPDAAVAKLKKVDASGKASRNGAMFPRLMQAVKLAKAYNDPTGHAILFTNDGEFGVAVFTGTIAQASTQVTAAPKLQFLQDDGEKFGPYSGAGSFSFEQARMLALETEGSGVVFEANGKCAVVKPPKNLQCLDSAGNPTKTRTTVLRPKAVKMAQSYSGDGTAVLIPETPRDFFVCVIPGDITAGFKATAAVKLQEFLGQDGNWTTYSDAKGYSASMARTLVLEHEDAALLPQPTGRVLVAKVPGGYSKMKFADMSGAPVSQADAATFKLHTAMKMAESVTDAKQTGMLVPLGFTDFQVILFKGGLVQASADMDADDMGDETAAGEWPFATDETAECAPPSVSMPVESSDDGDADDVTFKDDELDIESDAMPGEDDMADNMDIELEDLDEVANADEMAPVVEEAHSELELPATPAELDAEQSDFAVVYDEDTTPSDLVEPKILEVATGDDLADVMEMDDSAAGLSFEAKAGRIVAMKGHVAIASLTKEGAGQNADIMRTQGFFQATASLAAKSGLRKTLASVGFKMIKVPVLSKVAVSREVAKAVQASSNKQAEQAAALSESMAIAAAGLARGRWKGKENPLLAAFTNELNALGMRNSERVVARILASSLVPFTKTLIEVASDVNKLSPAARKETASMLEMTNAEALPVDNEEAPADIKSELEDRFQTTAAVLRATLPVVASGSRSGRQTQVVAAAHSRAMAILSGDQPLVLGQ